MIVAPYTGVWIETSVLSFAVLPTLSLPTRECGLKQSGLNMAEGRETVAPYTGVWIETPRVKLHGYQNAVAPYTGVWIETSFRP